MRIGFANPLHQLGWWLIRLSARLVKPLNVLRICRRRTEVLAIIVEAKQGSPPWAPDLVERVIQYVLEGGNSDLSVYRTATTNPLDQDHALGLIAEGITQKDFQRNSRKRTNGCSRGTFLIPTLSLLKNAHHLFTPQNNRNFFPANSHHYELCNYDSQKLAGVILDGIHNRAINWASLGNDDGSYRVQAAIAYSYCLSQFGNLNQANPPSRWQSGINLTSGEQNEILMHLAKVPALDSPLQ